MATGSAIRAGQAFVELLFNDNALMRGLNAAGGKLKSWGAGIAKVGAAVTGAGGAVLAPLLLSVNKFAEVGTELQRVHETTGMSVKDLAGLKKLAGESGIGFEELTTDLNKFQQNIGSGKAAKALHDIGVNAAGLNGKTMADQLAAVADAFARIEDPAQKANAARELFGRGAQSFISVLNRGGAAIHEYMDASKLWTGQDAERAQEFTRNTKRITGAVDSIEISFGGGIVEAFGSYLKPLVSGAKAAAAWVQEHRSLAATAAAGAAAVAGIGAAITVAGFGFMGAGAAVTAIGGILGAVLSPVGLVGAAIAALAGGLIYLASTNSKTAEGFAALKGRLAETFGGMGDAIKAGDWTLAVKIGWLEIQGEFWRGTKAVRLAWFDLIQGISDKWSDFVLLVTDGDWVGAVEGFFTNLGRRFAEALAEGVKQFESEEEAKKRKGQEQQLQNKKDLENAMADAINQGGDPFKALNNEKARQKAAADAAAKAAADAARDEKRGKSIKASEEERNRIAGGFDAKIGSADAARAKAIAEAAAKAAKGLEKAVEPQKQGNAAMMAIADASKGTFSPYAISQSLGIGDKIGERIAQATERAADALDQIKNQPPAKRPPVFKDDGG